MMLADKMRAAAAAAGGALATEDVFSTYLYTGNGTSQTITNGIDLAGEGGLVWIKPRNISFVHQLFDTERGFGTTFAYRLISDDTNAQSELADGVSAFNSDGFSLGNSGVINGSSYNYASWTFRKAPSFFDVVTYTGDGVAGRTVPHNLGVAPEMMIVKAISETRDWSVYHAGMGNTHFAKLNTTDAAIDYLLAWNDTTPDETFFTLGSGPFSNGNNQNFIAYLFATLPGVSKVGSYTGNGSSQTIDCGFTSGARFVLIKRADSTGDWYVWDSARGIVAGNDPHLSLNTNAVEVTTDDSIDPDSSGFIVNQVAATNINVSSASYIYLAIS